MKQQTFAAGDFERFRKPTRREQFLLEMDEVVPWKKLCNRIEPFYPKAGNGRPPVGLVRMLRIYFLQHWFTLSDPGAEEALYESRSMCRFVGIDLGREPVPDETTILNFRHYRFTRWLRQPPMCMTRRCWKTCCTERRRGCGGIRPTVARRRPCEAAPAAQDFTDEKGRRNQPLDAAAKARNRTKSKVRARVEHIFAVIKRVFGFTKVRYRGLDKNANALFVLCGLTNLCLARRRLRYQTSGPDGVGTNRSMLNTAVSP
jgi:IS5 family transposase